MRALFLSPHLDDVVFSCGATLARLASDGHEPMVLTIFTGNVDSPQGFALQCQTSKGLAPNVDYMALRRAEDGKAAKILGVQNLIHWPFLEAPHRGYNSAPELFAGLRSGDEIWQEIAVRLAEIGNFDVVFCPQGLGNHVDHQQVLRAALAVFAPTKIYFYRDTPYAIREPHARASSLLPLPLTENIVPFGDDDLERKIAACCSYESQIGFQFGGAQAVREKLTAFHRAEGWRGEIEDFAERFLVRPDSPRLG